MGISSFGTIIAGLPLTTALREAATTAGTNPHIVELIRYAGFAVMALGIVVIIRRWWRNR